jgi:hypothetical protein
MLHSCPFSAVVQVEGESMGVLKRACKANNITSQCVRSGGLPGTWSLFTPKGGDCPAVGSNDIRPAFGTEPCRDGSDSVSHKKIPIMFEKCLATD